MDRKRYYAVLGGCLIASTTAMQALADRNLMEDALLLQSERPAGAEVIVDVDVIHAEALETEGLELVKIKIINARGEVVFSDSTQAANYTLFLTELGLEDGDYSYEITTIFDRGELQLPFLNSTRSATKRSGRLQMLDGYVVIPEGSLDKTSGDDRDQAAASRQPSWLMRFAGTVMDFIVPSAQAQNLTATSTEPLVRWDDSDTNCCEWMITTQATVDATTGDSAAWRFRDYMGSIGPANSGHDVISIFGKGGQTLNENSLVVNSSGNMSLANGTMFINRGQKSVNIGSNASAGFGGLQVTGETSSLFALWSEDPVDHATFLFSSEAGFGIAQDLAFLPLFFELGTPSNLIYGAANGNLGIGTDSPTSTVDVSRSGTAASFQLTSYTDMANQAAQYVQRRSRGSSAAPAAVQNGDNLGLVSFRGHNGSDFSGTRAFIASQATQNWTGGANGSRMVFGTTPNGSASATTVMEITQNGQVRINGVLLSVPDYVFEDDYPLMSLDELSAFIDTNKHLPGVANADEVKSEGLDVAGSQMAVLEKVEELYLYTLQQHERLNSLDDENAKLRAENAILRSAYGTMKSDMARLEQLEETVGLLLQERLNDAVLTTSVQ